MPVPALPVPALPVAVPVLPVASVGQGGGLTLGSGVGEAGCGGAGAP